MCFSSIGPAFRLYGTGSIPFSSACCPALQSAATFSPRFIRAGSSSSPILFFFVMIIPGVLVGIPLGAYLIRRLDAETFRRICMSFDAWVVGFGLSRVLIDLKLMESPWAYSVMVLAIVIDSYLLYVFFTKW